MWGEGAASQLLRNTVSDCNGQVRVPGGLNGASSYAQISAVQREAEVRLGGTFLKGS